MGIGIVIEIQKGSNEAWYSEAVGIRFNAWKSPTMPGVYFVHDKLFVLGEDCKVVYGEEKKEQIQYFD